MHLAVASPKNPVSQVVQVATAAQATQSSAHAVHLTVALPKNPAAHVSQVAAERDVTIPTARSAVGRLKTGGYVRQERYGKLVLTDKGMQRGAEVYRAHSVIF